MEGKRIIIESHIPFVGNELEGVATVERLAPEAITRDAVVDADALIVRTRTRCDAALLEGTKVGFVATATIGTDHIDEKYCRERGIQTMSAPGCNAPAVAQYVWASVLTLLPATAVSGLTIGIVGLGHVGSIVARWAQALGVRVLACDPPRQRRDGGWNIAAPMNRGAEPFAGLDRIAAEADIITFHTPHTTEGDDATHHLAGDAFFASLRRQPIIVNAARGPIVDTPALVRAAAAGKVSQMVIDCWEGEPQLNEQLLRMAAIATPHIAGYSIEGKQRATAATLRGALRYFGAPQERIDAVNGPAVELWSEINANAILASYSPTADTAAMRENFSPMRFEQMRNSYNLRHELR